MKGRLLKDVVSEKIAKYLQKTLNSAHPGIIIVKSVAAYDKFEVPLSDYPLLKVYRLSDQFYERTELRRTSMVAAYCLALPDHEQLAGITNVIADEINSALTKLHTETGYLTQGENRAEYRTLMNEQGIPVYAFLRVYFTVLN